MTEEWRPIADFEGFCEVSNQGRVRSVSRRTSNGVRGGKVLTPTAHYKNGYLSVGLKANGVSKRKLVHRLVLEAFVGPCPEGMEACHGPAGKHDNSLSNLAWDTHLQNTGPDRTRDRKQTSGEKMWKAKHSWEQVCAVRRLLAEGRRNIDIASLLGVEPSFVRDVKAGKSWKRPPEEW